MNVAQAATEIIRNIIVFYPSIHVVVQTDLGCGQISGGSKYKTHIRECTLCIVF
jgi:hypothetical protein